MDQKIINQAVEYFKQYPKADEVYTTGDGVFFLKDQHSAAKTYATQQGKKLKEILRDDVDISEDEVNAEGAAKGNKAPEQETDDLAAMKDKLFSKAEAWAKETGKTINDVLGEPFNFSGNEKPETGTNTDNSGNQGAGGQGSNEGGKEYPEGEPQKDGWTKLQIIAYGKANYPDLTLAMTMKEDTLLDKIKKAKDAAKGGNQEGA